MVGIEDGHQFGFGAFHGGIQVAGLGSLVVHPGQVFTAQFFSEHADVLSASVVEDPHRLRGVVHVQGANQGPAQHAKGFVVGGDVDIDRRQVLGLAVQRHQLSFSHHGGLEVPADHHRKGIEFGGQQGQTGHRVSEGVQGQGPAGAPVQVAHGGSQADEYRRQSPLGHGTGQKETDAHHRQADAQVGPEREVQQGIDRDRDGQ